MRRCMGCMKELEDEVTECPYCGYIRGTTVKEAYYLFPETVLHKNYMVGKVLGYGGFGITYIGWDLVLNRVVAIKEYFPSDYATRGYGVTRLTIYSGDAALTVIVAVPYPFIVTTPADDTVTTLLSLLL